ncbi:acyl carrier protein [Pseudomonas lini]|uniref:acyl carrier protein n=1 Tax=Pseudomonas lini TaxID=163011 RepID=UPI00278B31E8|nr:acyl carrier protein [Pseudomonas lini]MDQ0121858.1 acyl carrier protein [Pseudomonas lini]
MFDVICQTIKSLSIQGILPAHLNSSVIKANDTLLDLGLDSMGQLTLLSELKGRLSVNLPADQVDAMTTLHELALILERANTLEFSTAV